MNRNKYNNKKFLLKLFNEGINVVRPNSILERFINVDDSTISILDNKKFIHYKNIKSVLPICIGKASVEMAKSFNKIFKKSNQVIQKGIIIVNEENFKKVKNFKCFKSGHPLPNYKGLIAKNYLKKTLSKTTQNDLILLMLSGGGSAMLPYPPEKITLEDKIYVNQQLLKSGANIIEINTVRKHLSLIKGGNFLKFTDPSKVHTLIISDVIGDDLSSISSGLTVPDPSTFKDVINICEKYNLIKKLPTNVLEYLKLGVKKIVPETPKKDNLIFKKCKNTIIASNTKSLERIYEILENKKITVEIWKRNLEGNVKEVAKEMIKYLIKKKEPTFLISGGETTVKIVGKGKGGRNQELSLYFCLLMKKYLPKKKFIFLSGGTDGRDGPTNSAGGIVDHTSIDLCEKKKINITEELNNNNSYFILEKINSHIMIKGTNTNVADIQILSIW